MTKGLTAVRDSSLLSVDVSELLRRPGATQHISLSTDLDGLAGEMARVREGSSLNLDLHLDALVDGIHASGELTGELAELCSRCLRTIQGEVRVDLDELFLYPSEETDDGDAYAISEDSIDLEPLVRDAVILALPLNPLCRPDCKGLCPECGADRNDVDCGHTGARVDIRWDALKRLRESMEE
jgi:uncharacterized protein